MKKNLIIAILMFASMSAFAQRAIGSLNIQPKLGLNIASMTNFEGPDARIAFVAGAEAEYQVTDMLSISAGALYSQQGVKMSNEESYITAKTDYVNIPILANVYVIKGLAVKLGVQPGFMINDKAKVKADEMYAEVDLSDLLKQEIGVKLKSFDLSIPVGLSYEFNNIQIDARYNWGLTKLIKYESESTKHSVFQITLGYKFGL